VSSPDLVEMVKRIVSEIELGMKCWLRVEEDEKGIFVQVCCQRIDVITGEEGEGRSGKAYPSDFATESEILQMIFGLYKGYWEHEARENFQWLGRRIYGPHIKARALLEVARQIEVRSAMHIEDMK
jgi:hypothetical protein